MARREKSLHHPSMYTSMKNPKIGDRVRLTGFLGVFEVVRIFQHGTMVDLKHLDLYGPDYIEREVSTHDLTYLCSSRPPVILNRTDSQPADYANSESAQGDRRRLVSQPLQSELA
jgi:hypothetical protein